jgi:hypothetical protein
MSYAINTKNNKAPDFPELCHVKVGMQSLAFCKAGSSADLKIGVFMTFP